MRRSYIAGRRYRNCRSRWTPGDCRRPDRPDGSSPPSFPRRIRSRREPVPDRQSPAEASRTAGGLFRGGVCLQFMTGDAAQLVHRPEPGHAHALAHPAIGHIAQVQRGPDTAPGQHSRPAAADAPDIARGGPGERRADPGGIARQVENPSRPWRAFGDPVGDLGQGLGRADPDRYRDAGQRRTRVRRSRHHRVRSGTARWSRSRKLSSIL